MTDKYVCVHGHFYQPPRESPWLEAIERQESAFPDHDWNDRITRECYSVNAKARMLDDAGLISGLLNNYEHISFNFGPTLLAWLESKAPGTYAAIIAADKNSARRFSGHGSAIAQAYNHAILPLCNDRDRRTQIAWGIADFELRFGRRPEGMWLPEMAVDTPTLEALADAGIRFTILSDRQAASFRHIGEKEWVVPQHGVDSRHAYLCPLPSGRSITLFFHNTGVAHAVAFEGLLRSGAALADRLAGAVGDGDGPRLAHIATGGETFGHHYRHGEMALADALHRLWDRPDIRITNYGEFLELHPPQMEVRIHEPSSWSCAHGVERWKSDCGCNSGRKDWHQLWRGPLREAFDWLRDSIAGAFERAGGELLADPWAARDAYVSVVLRRGSQNIERFLTEHGTHSLSEAARQRTLELMEMQRHALLMYTSCGWFFDDVSGMETLQVVQYAGRVVQLARRALGIDLETEFEQRLARAPGNNPAQPDGKAVYEQCVRPAMVDLHRVGAHYAIMSLFDGRAADAGIYCFDVRPEDERRRSSGQVRLLIGRACLRSRITLEHTLLTYAVLHLGDHNLYCGVREFRGQKAYEEVVALVEEAFESAHLAEVIRRLDKAFEDARYSVTSLFRDEQHAVVRKILEPNLAQIDSAYRQIYEQHAPMTRFLKQLDLPVPRRIQMVGGFVLTQSIRTLLQARELNLARLRELRDEAEQQKIELDAGTVGGAAREALIRTAAQVAATDEPADALALLAQLVKFIRSLPLSVDLWPAQEVFIEHVLSRRDEMQDSGDEASRLWLGTLRDLGAELSVRL